MSISTTTFRSKLGFLVVAAGSAIGLGNIWKFPYLAGENGGSAFVLLYLFFAIFIGALVILAEVLLGRLAQRNAIDAFGSHRPDGKSLGWKTFGGLGLFGTLFISFFYPVVAGWVVIYLFKLPTLLVASKETVVSTFSQISSAFSINIYATVFVTIITSFVVSKGLVNGTERVGLFLLPILFILLVILAFHSLMLDNASAGVAYYLSPDFSKITGHTVLAALGQALFSLSVGSGLMITFGSYMKEKSCSVKSSLSVMAADTLVAFLAGLIIMPALFAYSISPSAGPGLLFITLPTVFAHMGGGIFWGLLFFFLVFIAAFTTTISVTEALSAFVAERFNLSRKKAVFVFSVVQIIGQVFVIGSLSGTFPIKLFGKNLFDFFSDFTSNYAIPLAALAVTLYLGIYYRKSIIEKSETLISAPFNKCTPLLVNLIGFVLPVVIIGVLLMGLFG